MPKSIFISIIGRPNVGKSTLINAIVDKKIAITSPKPQTTRHNILGVITKNDTQYAFIDTPGIHKSNNAIGRKMNELAINSIDDQDCLLYLVDKPYSKEDDLLLDIIKKCTIPVILVITKIDKLPSKSSIDDIIISFLPFKNWHAVVPISSFLKTHFDFLFETLDEYSVDDTFHFANDYLTDQSDNDLIKEYIREKILFYINEEVPHGVFVVVESFNVNRVYKTIDISCLIIVERDSQKGILIGKNGTMLKKIGSEARLEINKLLKAKIHLELYVKVEKNWRQNPNVLKKYAS